MVLVPLSAAKKEIFFSKKSLAIKKKACTFAEPPLGDKGERKKSRIALIYCKTKRANFFLETGGWRRKEIERKRARNMFDG